jgi:hypothetical protein
VRSTQQFIETLDTYSPGETVALTVGRGGSTLAIKVKFGTRPRTVTGGCEIGGRHGAAQPITPLGPLPARRSRAVRAVAVR